MQRIVIAVALLLPAARADAFCGFFVAGGDAKLYNNASQVVLMRNEKRTVMTMSNNYKGPAENFAMVVPVPVVLQKEDVKTLPMDVFDKIDQLSAPRLVEYWEQDPCYVEKLRVYDRAMPSSMPPPSPAPGGAKGGFGVKVEAQFTVGEYEIVILSAQDSSGLEKWLRFNKYSIPKGADAALAPYVREQSKFFVAKVDIKKVKHDSHGLVQLSPLRFGFDSDELRLPVRLGLLNADDANPQDLIVYLLSPTSRFEVANYPNVFVPTNLEVADDVRKNFGAFYAELFDETLKRNHGKAVVTEYSWQTTSCDPCPVPPLQPGDLATLGAGGAAPDEQNNPQGKWQGRQGGMYYGAFSPWVLTRLHTRYSRATLSEDLVFREAKPVLGGRANWDGTSADEEAKIQPAGGVNNFQGRYIIRHYWTGPVKCQNPTYGRWGGPPGGGGNEPQAARDLAQAPRGKVSLAKVVNTKVPSLGLPGHPPPKRK